MVLSAVRIQQSYQHIWAYLDIDGNTNITPYITGTSKKIMNRLQPSVFPMISSTDLHLPGRSADMHMNVTPSIKDPGYETDPCSDSDWDLTVIEVLDALHHRDPNADVYQYRSALSRHGFVYAYSLKTVQRAFYQAVLGMPRHLVDSMLEEADKMRRRESPIVNRRRLRRQGAVAFIAVEQIGAGDDSENMPPA